MLAEALAERVLGEGVEIADRFPGRELIGAGYEPPFPFIPADAYGEKHRHRLPGDFVTAKDGTGIVHTAPPSGKTTSASVPSRAWMSSTRSGSTAPTTSASAPMPGAGSRTPIPK